MTLQEFLDEWHNDNPLLLVHTSGSTGQPKPLWVEKSRMEASARITCRFLGLREGDTALLCMPLDYIAGKMMVVRALTCRLKLKAVEPSGHPLKGLTSPPHFAAMVPLQVYHSLEVEEERTCLAAIKQLIIGGGAIDDTLAEKLRQMPNAIWSTYGMTETLSHIALRRVNGKEASLWYTPLEGVSVSLNADGCLTIDAPAVCPQQIVTNDIAELRDGRFRILGRRDNTVCSGGVKIQIEEAERLLKPHVNAPIAFTKRRDPMLGEALVLVGETADKDALRRACQAHLPRYWQPRNIVTTDRIPLTATGKTARAELEKMVAGTSNNDNPENNS